MKRSSDPHCRDETIRFSDPKTLEIFGSEGRRSAFSIYLPASLKPAVKVLISSGCSIEGKANGILALGCNGLIQKPFSMNALSQKIRFILEESGNPSEANGSRQTE
jgi:hypothetical protein